MSSEWPIVTLSDAGITLIDCDHKTPKAQDSGFPYVGIPQLKDGRIILDGARLISEEDFNHWRRKAKPQPHDVILSRRCNPGKSAYVPENLEVALGQNLVLLRADGEKVHPPFLRWLTQGDEWWEQVSKFINVGAVFDSLKCADIPKFEFKLPPKFQQERISSILSEIDNKVIINTRINETLEEIAQALFKSWFVDFDPVKAKMEALAAGGSQAEAELAAMSVISAKTPEELKSLKESSLEAYSKLQDTAALFPSAMQESELGLIPEEWRVSTIGEEVHISGGGTPSTKNKDFWENGSIHWTTPKDLSNLQDKVLVDTERKITELGLEKISSGLLPVDTVLLSSRAPVGYLALVKVPVAINQGYIAMRCENILSPEYVLQWAASNMEEIKQRASGTTFAEISKKNFRPILVIVPTEGIIKKYSDQAQHIYKHIYALVEENKNLSIIRDTLLPPLLSGRQSIKERMT